MNTSTQKRALELRSGLRVVAIIAAIAVLLCISQLGSPACVVGTLPDPTKTVSAFFDALTSGKYEECDEYITEYTTLGLNAGIRDESVAKLYSEMLGSFSYSIIGEPVVEGSNARVEVELSRLDIPAALKAAEEKTAIYLRSAVQDYEGTVYNDDGSYTEELLAAVRAEIVEDIIESKADYIITENITIQLRYESGWYIVPDEPLLKALSGGMM